MCSTLNAAECTDDLDSSAVSTTISRRFDGSSGSRPFRSSGSNGVRPFKYSKLPPLIIHSSSTPDEKRSKTNDDRYIPNSFDDPGRIPDFSTQAKLLKKNDNRYFANSSHNVTYTLDSDGHLHVIFQDEAQCDAAEAGSTTEPSIESIDSDESGSASPAHYKELTLAYTKHQIILSLMRDVYAMFSSQWQANVRTRTTPEAESGRVLLNSCESTDCSKSNRLGKRANYQRDRSQGDGNDGKKRRTSPPDTANCEPDLQLACPFHKYDPVKYCPNIDGGVKYRTCLGPGFPTISRLK